MATEKQLKALEKARTKRLNKIYGRQYAELIAKNKKLIRADEKHVSYENIKARINKAQTDYFKLTGKKLTRTEALKSISHSATFMSSGDIYKTAIVNYMSLGDKNSLRKLIADKTGQGYRETSINWDKFTYDSGLQAIVDNELGIYAKIVKGKDSTEPDFTEIGSL